MEQDDDYFKAATDRIENHQHQKSLENV